MLVVQINTEQHGWGIYINNCGNISNIQWLYCSKKGQLTYFGPSEGSRNQINNNCDFFKNGCGDSSLLTNLKRVMFLSNLRILVQYSLHSIAAIKILIRAALGFFIIKLSFKQSTSQEGNSIKDIFIRENSSVVLCFLSKRSTCWVVEMSTDVSMLTS